MYYVYVLHSIDKGDLYIGFTNNIERRISEHISGHTKTTKSGTYKLIFYEGFTVKEDALAREKKFKTGFGRERIKREILKNYFNK